MPHPDKHPEEIEPTWPVESVEEEAVNELVSEHQGATPPFGDDIELPVALERHGRHYTVRPPGSPRQDTDFGGDEAI